MENINTHSLTRPLCKNNLRQKCIIEDLNVDPEYKLFSTGECENHIDTDEHHLTSPSVNARVDLSTRNMAEIEGHKHPWGLSISIGINEKNNILQFLNNLDNSQKLQFIEFKNNIENFRISIDDISKLNSIEFLASIENNIKKYGFLILLIKNLKLNLLKEIDCEIRNKLGKEEPLYLKQINNNPNIRWPVFFFFFVATVNMLIAAVNSFFGGIGIFNTISTVMGAVASGIFFWIFTPLFFIIILIDVFAYYRVDISKYLKRGMGLQNSNFTVDCLDKDRAILRSISSISKSISDYYKLNSDNIVVRNGCRKIHDNCKIIFEAMKAHYSSKNMTESYIRKIWSSAAIIFKGVGAVLATSSLILHALIAFTPPNLIILVLGVVLFSTVKLYYYNTVKQRKNIYSPEIIDYENFQNKIKEYTFFETTFDTKNKISKARQRIQDIENERHRRPLSHSHSLPKQLNLLT